jgi:arsenate reductase (glutaredoxin)
MSIKFFEYKKCSTCQKARKFLDNKKISYEEISIIEQPPTVAELKMMLKYIKSAGGSIKNLFNTSGVQYRELKISEKLKSGLTEAESLELLSKNGRLIKRPFLLTKKTGTVGFKEAEWTSLLV